MKVKNIHYYRIRKMNFRLIKVQNFIGKTYLMNLTYLKFHILLSESNIFCYIFQNKTISFKHIVHEL